MTAVLSRLSMGLEAIRRGMQQQKQAAAETARAAVRCLPTLANHPDFVAASTTISASSKGAAVTAHQQQQQQDEQQPLAAPNAPPGTPFASPTADKGVGTGVAIASSDKKEDALLQVDKRLWGPLPGSLLQLGFALRAALRRLMHDSFGSLCIHSLQLTLPSPCQLLTLPAVPATTRLLPTTTFRRTLTAEATYFLCCLTAAPLSPCVAVDLVLTIKGLKNPACPSAEQAQQRKWHAHFAAPTGAGLGSATFNNRFGATPFDTRGSRHGSSSYIHQQPHNNPHAYSSTAGANASPLDRLSATGMQHETAFGSVKVAVPLLRLELLKRPRIPDDAVSSAQEVAHDTSPRIALSQACGPMRRSKLEEAAVYSKSQGTMQQQAPRQPNCVLEVLLKELELSFVSEKNAPDNTLQNHRPANGLGGSRRLFGSTAFLGRPATADTEATQGAGGSSDGVLRSPVSPFRVVMSLHDCIIRGEDGSRLLQNASVVPKLFSGEFGGSAGGSHTQQNQFSAAGAPSQSAAGNASPTGAHAAGEGVGTSGRRAPQKTRLAFRQALISEMPLQDPLLQCLAWVADGVIFVSAEMAHLRVQLRALQGANVYAWGIGLYGAVQQLKHFRLQFPAISFGCCFSTASWLVPIGVNAQQLLRVAQLQARGPSSAVPEHHHRHSEEEDEEQTIRKSLLLHRRGLGLLSLLYPALHPPALAPDDWNGLLPLQLPAMAASMSIQRVLQVLEDDAATREAAAAAANTTAETTAVSAPWRLQTADLFQLHSDLQTGMLQQPVWLFAFVCSPLI